MRRAVNGQLLRRWGPACVRWPAQTRRRKRPVAEQPPLRGPGPEFVPFIGEIAQVERMVASASAWRAQKNGATRGEHAGPVSEAEELQNQHFPAKSSPTATTSPAFFVGGERAPLRHRPAVASLLQSP